MKKLLLLLIIISNQLFSANCSSITNGDWNNPLTWSCGYVPLCSDIITISPNTTVTISSSIQYTCNTTIHVYGTMLFTTSNKLLLDDANSKIYVYSGGFIKSNDNNASQKIKIGTNSVWEGNDPTITGVSIVTTNGITNALPIELLYFKSDCVFDNTLIEWKTTYEKDVKFYQLEASTDALEWKTLDYINIINNASITQLYQYLDTNSYDYYKLSEITINNTKIEHSIIHNECNKTHISINPNPSNILNITINNNDIYMLTIHDNDGKLVLIKEISFKFKYELPKGMYYINLTNTKDTYNKIFVISE